jgi:hypothetical protein
MFALAASHDASGHLTASSDGQAVASAEQLAKDLEEHVSERYQEVPAPFDLSTVVD